MVPIPFSVPEKTVPTVPVSSSVLAHIYIRRILFSEVCELRAPCFSKLPFVLVLSGKIVQKQKLINAPPVRSLNHSRAESHMTKPRPLDLDTLVIASTLWLPLPHKEMDREK